MKGMGIKWKDEPGEFCHCIIVNGELLYIVM